jgi:hypothetical protein
LLNDLLNYDWETWKVFFEEHWIMLVIAIIILLFIIGIVKTVLKWALVAAIIVGILLYSGYSLKDLSLDNLKSIGTQVADSVKKEAVTAMAGEAKDAVYTQNEDGTFTVKSDHLTLSGKVGDNEVAVSFRDTPLGKWKVDETIQMFIAQAKQNG